MASPSDAVLRPPKKKSKKTLMSFKQSHMSQFGLKITARHQDTGEVSSCICKFCEVFGRESPGDGGAGRKRKKTERPKYFSTFRTDLYTKHLEREHPKAWKEYQELCSKSAKDEFFQKVATPFVNRLDSHLEYSSTVRWFILNAQIVDDIIGDMLFHPDDFEGVSHSRAMCLFEREELSEGSGDEEGNIGAHVYTVTIKTIKRFDLLVGIVGMGSSFRLAARTVQLVRDETGLAFYSGCTEKIASDYIRVVCAHGLQMLSECMRGVTGFSLALDSSTIHGMSYLDVRVRFAVEGTLYNFHLFAIPLFDQHSGELMCDALVRLMDVLHPDWRDFILSVCTDGARSTTGCIRGLATLVEEETNRKLVRVWCGLHQLDLVMQRVFKRALNEEFLSTLTATIGHLRRQQTLVTSMRSTCPRFADTRWISMYSTCAWLTRNIIVLKEHFTAKKPRCMPTIEWWIFLFGVHAFAEEAKKVFVSLQGNTTLLSEQRWSLDNLTRTYARMMQIKGPLTRDEVLRVDTSSPEVCGRFAVSHKDARDCIKGFDIWVVRELGQLNEDTQQSLVAATAKMFVEGVNGISEIVAGRDSDNEPCDVLPSVLPHELIHTSPEEFSAFLLEHEARLLKKMTSSEVHKIGRDFISLCNAYNVEEPLKEHLDISSSESISFVDAWAVVGYRFSNLQRFCGDIAFTFPNTATVEGDFSVLGWEKDVYRKRILDFSLEGILQARQYAALKKLHAHSSKPRAVEDNVV